MSVLELPGRPSAAPLPGWGWWLLLGLVIGLFVLWGPIPAVAVLAFLIIQRVRPFDFLTSYLMVMIAGSIVNYSAGHLTAELSVLTVGLLFMLFCYVLSMGRNLATVTNSRLTPALLSYGTLTLLNFARGLIVGNSPRYAGLELIAMLALESSFLVATLPLTRRVMAATAVALIATGIVHACLGLYAYAVIGMRTGAIFFQPIAGIIVSFGFPFVLREPDARRRWLWLLALVPPLLHQFLSFTRGFWMALIGTTIFSVVIYSGRGAGAGVRWRRSGLVLGVLLGAGVFVATLAAGAYGIQDIFTNAAERFASSGSTEVSFETTSNIVRLSEYMHVAEDIIHSPIIGYGLGYSFVVKDPISFVSEEHWFVHQNYLLVWLKQGLIGLALFVWVLISAFRTGWSGRNRKDPYEAAWCAGAAAVALHLLIYCNVHFPLAEVNSTFAVALMWGGAMSLTATGRTVLRWKADAGASGPPGGDGDRGPLAIASEDA
jgi:hypothetical protein